MNMPSKNGSKHPPTDKSPYDKDKALDDEFGKRKINSGTPSRKIVVDIAPNKIATGGKKPVAKRSGGNGGL